MAKPEPVRFRPSARLQRYLGQELISDPNLAIIEFVKNAYDAGATLVEIEFILDADPTQLIISDNGTGMSEEEFQENWMRPGFSHKSPDAPRRNVKGPGARSEARQLERQRIPAGEKGLGRMSAGRLGDRLDVYTRSSVESPWLHVPFVWSEFDDMTRAMDEVAIQPSFVAEAPHKVSDTGTVVVMTGLSQRWDGRIRGRPVPGRSRTKLGRLRQDLEFLMRPLGQGSGDFAIILQSDLVAHDDNGAIIFAGASDSADYEYNFEFYLSEGRAKVNRRIKRSPEVAEVSGQPPSENLGSADVTISDSEGRTGRAPLACGPFSGRFIYTPPQLAKRAAAITPMGVLLYRDGIWVEPYGIDSDDWLGVAARKAQRQGHAAVQPNSFSGHVSISRSANPGLLDMSNRMGLLENEDSEEFLALARGEFRYFEDIVYREVLETAWEGNKAEEAGKRAVSEAEQSAIFLRSLAHSVRQPLEGIQVELGIVEAVAEDQALPAGVRKTLQGVSRRAAKHAESAGRLISEALRFEVPKFGENRLREILENVRAQVTPLAEGVDLTFKAPDSATVLVPRQLVVQAVAAMVTNAIQASRPSGVTPCVDVTVRRVSDDWAIEVIDNGTGIAGYKAGMSLSDVRSTQGRPGEGLKLAELAARAARGRLLVAKTGSDGTHMVLQLPERSSGLRT